MRQYLLDTNHAGHLLRDNRELWARIRSTEGTEFGLCRPSLGELWFMVFNSAHRTENTLRLEQLVSYFRIWEYDDPASREFGRIRTELRTTGRPIPQIDVQIAVIARVVGLTLLTSDRHFKSVANVTTDDWLIGKP